MTVTTRRKMPVWLYAILYTAVSMATEIALMVVFRLKVTDSGIVRAICGQSEEPHAHSRG